MCDEKDNNIKTSLLRHLMFGISNIDKYISEPKSKEEYNEIAFDMRKRIKSFLPEQEAESIDRLDLIYQDMGLDEREYYFEQGFYLGLLLGIESRESVKEFLKDDD